MALIELQGVTKRYEGVENPVLQEIDLSIEAGDTAAIVGPSGSGKSTLLNIMGTLDRPTEGKVMFEATSTFDGHDVLTMSEKELAGLRNQRIGFIFQLHHLLPQCTILENVLIPSIPDPGGDDYPSRAKELLERVGLSHRLDHRPGQLSGGERQRVAVARALINRPALLLADEPTGSLDRAASESVVDLLLELNRDEKVAVVMVTHSNSLAAKMQRVMELHDGKLEDSKS